MSTVSGLNLVFAGSSDQMLYALNASSGALVWSYSTGGAVGSVATALGSVDALYVPVCICFFLFTQVVEPGDATPSVYLSLPY